MTTESENEIVDIAMDLANGMEKLCDGKPYAAVLTAFAMMLAESEARQPEPNIDRMLAMMSKWTRITFMSAMERRKVDEEHDADFAEAMRHILQ